MRRQLTLAAAAISSMIVLAFVVPLGLLVRTLAEDRAVANAERRAQVLVPVLATFTDPAQLEQVVAGLDRSDGTTVTVFLADGTVVGAPAPVDADVELARRGKAFNSEATAGVQVLLPVDTNGSIQVVRVLVSEDQRRLGVASAWLTLGALGLGLVVLATAVADRMGKSIVEPVGALAETAERLGHGDLDARVEVGGPPEIVEVGHTVNRLAARIGELLEAEREAGADLSHRLRTPITALRLDVDGLPDGEQKDRLVTDVDGLTRAVDRLISEARRSVRAGVGNGADLVGVVRDRVAFWSVLAEEQDRAVLLETPEGECAVAVPADDLEAALDALLGNVFAHTPDGVGYRVRVIDQVPPAGVQLVVDDDGPGLPDADVLQRGESRAGSTGLGLDIIRRTAEASGGTFDARTRAKTADDPGGTRIVVTFGRPV